MVEFPSLPPMPPSIPSGPPSKVLFYLQFSQEIQSLQSGHNPSHPNLEQIQDSAQKLHTFLTTNESKIKAECQKNGWSFDETNSHFTDTIEALQDTINNPSALESAQSASGSAERIFNQINSTG